MDEKPEDQKMEVAALRMEDEQIRRLLNTQENRLVTLVIQGVLDSEEETGKVGNLLERMGCPK